MYEIKYHNSDLSDKSFLVTGGAGFIGSNIVRYLLKYQAKKVRVLDNLSTGYFENIQEFIDHASFEFIEGDIRDQNVCNEAMNDINYVTHQAALGSVPRSVADPITTNEVNITGFLNIIAAVKDSVDIRRMVYAASSSSYGNSNKLPKVEGQEGNLLSPYAVTKFVDELYADVFSRVYGIHTIGLRYFNVFGPGQDPNSTYAAVIPKLCKAIIKDQKFTVNGDGGTSRDFTHIENVVQANIKALLLNDLDKHEVFNIACGDQTTLLEMIHILERYSNKTINIEFGPERVGDVKHSMANIDKARASLNYSPLFSFKEALPEVYMYYLNKTE